ncbi:MAG: allantoinase AllB [Candidatus Auribacterota bacterium]|nr:allantoinase AllB [Candidatus Auribacterota bacterium]
MIIKDGNIALPGAEELVELDIRVAGGKIVELGSGLSGDDEIIEALGMIVLPGGIDSHVHFDDPGFTEREDFAHGTAAAASGGITTIIDMPCTSIPPVTTLAHLQKKLSVVEKKAVIDFGFRGGIAPQSMGDDYPENFRELNEIVFGFKTYFISIMELFSGLDHFQFRNVLKQAAEFGATILLHAEDFSYVTAATEVLRQAGKEPIDYYRSRPEVAEVLAVRTALELAEETGADLHIVHVSTAKSAQLIAMSSASVTCETCPHYLQFDLDDFIREGAVLKTTPPVKKPGNSEKLWQYLSDTTIDFAASDHAPCPASGKGTGSIWTDYAGIPGTVTLLPYLYSEGYTKDRLSLRRLVEVISETPARRYGLYPEKGAIEIGTDADLVLINPDQTWTVEGKKFLSKGHITPFEGMVLQGPVNRTIVRGRTVYEAEDGIQVEGGYGQFLSRA